MQNNEVIQKDFFTKHIKICAIPESNISDLEVMHDQNLIIKAIRQGGIK